MPENKKALAILDDDPMFLKLARAVFEKEGWEVREASGWAELLPLLYRDKIRLVLCDVNMPGPSGDQVCKILKDTNLSGTPPWVVLISAEPPEVLEKLAQQCQADGWISKMTPHHNWVKTVNQIWQKI